jgi:hypothetical protein
MADIGSALPGVGNSISILEIRDTFYNPTTPIYLGDYWVGGNHVPESTYNPYYIPTSYPSSPSNPIRLSQFYSTGGYHYYAAKYGGVKTYQAQVGFSLEQYNGILHITYGLISNVFHVNANTANDFLDGTWGTVIRQPLPQAGIRYRASEYYDTSAAILHYGSSWDSNSMNFYNLDRWWFDAQWSGNYITIYFNNNPTYPYVSYGGFFGYSGPDTGTYITYNNLINSWADIAGTYIYISGYKTVSLGEGLPTGTTPIYAIGVNTSYTFKFR